MVSDPWLSLTVSSNSFSSGKVLPLIVKEIILFCSYGKKLDINFNNKYTDREVLWIVNRNVHWRLWSTSNTFGPYIHQGFDLKIILETLNYHRAHIVIPILITLMIDCDEVTSFCDCLFEEFNNEPLQYKYFPTDIRWQYYMLY